MPRERRRNKNNHKINIFNINKQKRITDFFRNYKESIQSTPYCAAILSDQEKVEHFLEQANSCKEFIDKVKWTQEEVCCVTNRYGFVTKLTVSKGKQIRFNTSELDDGTTGKKGEKVFYRVQPFSDGSYKLRKITKKNNEEEYFNLAKNWMGNKTCLPGYGSFT